MPAKSKVSDKPKKAPKKPAWKSSAKAKAKAPKASLKLLKFDHAPKHKKPSSKVSSLFRKILEERQSRREMPPHSKEPAHSKHQYAHSDKHLKFAKFAGPRKRVS